MSATTASSRVRSLSLLSVPTLHFRDVPSKKIVIPLRPPGKNKISLFVLLLGVVTSKKKVCPVLSAENNQNHHSLMIVDLVLLLLIMLDRPLSFQISNKKGVKDCNVRAIYSSSFYPFCSISNLKRPRVVLRQARNTNCRVVRFVV